MGSPAVLAGPDDALVAARSLAARIASRAGEHDRLGCYPAADLEDLRRAGLLGLMVPRRLGGPGAGFEDYARLAMVLGEASGATALVFNMHASVTGALALTDDDLARAAGAPAWWFDRRDELLLEALGGSLFAVAMSERGAGSRLSRLQTSYRRCGQGFHLAGEKAFVSAAGHADHYLVAARSELDAAVVSWFLVPSSAGTEVVEAWDALGMRATASHDLRLDARLDERALVGGLEGAVLLIARLMPQWLVASYAAVYAGVARAALRAGAAHAAGRGHKSLAAVRARLGRADAAVAACELTVLEAARRVDEEPGTPGTNRWVYRAKLLAGETAATVASSMLEAAGTSATARGHPLERLFRDARCGSLQPATSDVCADWLGLATLGADPDADADVPRW